MIYGVKLNLDSEDEKMLIEALSNIRRLSVEEAERVREEYLVKGLNGTVKVVDSILDRLDKGEHKDTLREEIDDVLYDNYLYNTYGLTCYEDPYANYLYIGREYYEMDLDQTRREFEQEVASKLKRIFPSIDDSDFKVYLEAWFDG